MAIFLLNNKYISTLRWTKKVVKTYGKKLTIALQKKGTSLMNINLRQSLIQIVYFKVEIKMYEKVKTLSQTDFDYFTKITVKSC